MEMWKIALIVIAVVTVLLLIIAVNVILLKKKKEPQHVNDRELIAENCKSVNSMLILAGATSNIAVALKNLQEKLKYLVPSEKIDVIEYDEVIKTKLCSLEAFLKKSYNGLSSPDTDSATESETARRITEIEVIVADRNTIL
ncbi:MAG: hypothetical protein K2N50_05390 [Clostridia bacterium]|nr:hypothetical protein [Clostridia bacterium]